MNLFRSIANNFKLISLHFNIWLFKFLIIFFSFEPLRVIIGQFFEGKTINDRLFAVSDPSALFEMIWELLQNHGNPIGILLTMIVGLSIFILVIDSLIDCGFIAAYYHTDRKQFWVNLKDNANRMILLKITLVIPYLFMVILIGGSLTFFINPITYQFPLGTNNLFLSMLILIVLSSLFLIFLRTIDHAKINLILKKQSVSDSLLSGFRKLFSDFKNIVQINFLTALSLAVGIIGYSYLNESINIDNSIKIIIITIIFQLVIFLKQVLRFSYTGAIIETDFKN